MTHESQRTTYIKFQNCAGHFYLENPDNTEVKNYAVMRSTIEIHAFVVSIVQIKDVFKNLTIENTFHFIIFYVR